MNNRASWVTLFACGAAAVLAGCGGADSGSALFTGGTENGAGAGGSLASGGHSASAGNSFGGSSGSGASSASGGRSGSGGTSGTAGSSASGAGGSSTGTCVSGVTVPPVAALITDFSDVVPDPSNAAAFRFGGGVATRVQGGTTTFSNPASTAGTLSVNGGALSFSATVSAPAASGADQFPFNGFVLFIDGQACIDASAYSGVSFVLSGNLGNCNLTFAFAYADDLGSVSDPNRGLCSGTCYPSQFALTQSSTSVSFSATPTVGGMPAAAVDKAKLVGVQWQLVPSGETSCTASFTIDNVMFQ